MPGRNISLKSMVNYATFFPNILNIYNLFFQVFTKALSTRSTKSLGDFDVQYLYNPEVLKIVEE
jgi:hypothetical protein